MFVLVIASLPVEFRPKRSQPSHRAPAAARRNAASRNSASKKARRACQRSAPREAKQLSAAAHHVRDPTAPATPPAQADTDPQASQTRDNERAPHSHTQNRATRVARRSAASPTPATCRPIAEKYAKTPLTAPTTPLRASKPPSYPAIPCAAPSPPAPETSHPAAAQNETPSRCGHAAKQTSPRDDKAHNVHRKKDIPQQARLTPPEKHSTSTEHAYASQPPRAARDS
jgi:hypothetical protein